MSLFRSSLVALALCWVSSAFLGAQEVTLVPTGALWKLHRGSSAPSPGSTTGWTQPAFNDTAWESAPATFFFGEDRLTGTDLPDMGGNYSTIFLRHHFTVADPANLADLELRAICDDGFVAYLNGRRVASYNAPTSHPVFTAVATANVPEPVAFESYALGDNPGLLVAGDNVLAVVVLNVSRGSSDLVFDAELVGRDLTPSPPRVAAVDPLPGLATNLNRITVTFSEPVTGVSAEHFLINGVPADSVIGGGSTYIFSFPPPEFGLVAITWGALHTIRDLDTPPMVFPHAAPGSAWTYELLDPSGPAVVGRQPAPLATLRHLSEVVVTFNRPVLNLDASDLTLNGQPATQVTGIGAGPYRFSFATPAAAGVATLAWAEGHGITSNEPVPHPFPGGTWTYTMDPSLPLPEIVINELLAENQGGLKDEDNDPEDWIELWNPGNTPINLGGWALSDGNDPEDEWVLPPVEVPAHGFLLVWASGKDRPGTGPRRELHTHFKLNPNGDRLRLLGPELPRPTHDEVEFGPQGADFSYGRQTDGDTTVWRYFAVPTPRADNGLSSITNQTAPVHFSVQRGYYDSPFHLHLTCDTPGAVIRYTTNGSPPVDTNGFIYSGPLLIQASRVIRAAAVAPDHLPSRVQTHTYLYGLPPSRRSLPALSLVTATNHLFGRTGIMETNPRNTTRRGPAWERPVSVEYFELGGNGEFQVDAGLRIQGGDYIRSRYNYRVSTLPESKYSFRLYFRGEYGEGRLRQPLFLGTTLDSFDTIVLRAGMNDPSNPFLKDEVIRQLSASLGQPASHGTFVHLFLNGAYRGYYNPTERIDGDFLQAYHGGGEEWDVMAQSGEVREGSPVSWNQLLSLAQTRPATNQANYQEFSARMDLTNFVDYLLSNIYVDTDDWPHNNWRAAREAVPGGLWRFYVWDAEWSFGQPNGHSATFNTINNQLSSLSPPWGSTEIQRLFNALKRGREFQLLFSDRVHRAFFNDGPLTDDRIRATYEAVKARLNTAQTIPSFNNGTINNWINNRRRYVLNHLATAGFNRSTNAPGLSQFGGTVPAGYALTLTNVSGTIYYTTDGSDPRVSFTEDVSSSARAYTAPLAIDRAFRLKARSLDGTTNWSALTEAVFELGQLGPAVRFTELMYNPPGGEAYEFVELLNRGSTPVDLSGFSFEGITLRFPSPFPALGPGARLVLASSANPAAFAARYPDVTVAAYYSGALNNAGERIALLDPEGRVVEAVTYSDRGLWPTSPDGGGSSLERGDLDGDPNAASTWHSSAVSGGTPGQPNSSPVPPVVRLNEIAAQPTQGPDWIELFNPGSSVIDLAGWSLTDNPEQPRRFVFPSGSEIAAGGFLRVLCDPDRPAAALRAPFGLSVGGEQVALFNADTNVVDSLEFGPQASGYTTGRIGPAGTWVLCEPTPDAPNEVAAAAGPEAVVLNEFLADSESGDDWIELHNPGLVPAVLTGGYLGTSNALFRISAPASIGPGGFAVLIADERLGPNQLDFKLPAAGGMIAWYGAQGLLVDRVDYSLQLPLVSSGRLPDGSGPWTRLPFSETPGASNYVAALGATVRFSEFMAINAGTVVAPDGQPADWIELHNADTQVLSLAGFTLLIDGQAPWTFPPGIQLGADARLVIWATERVLSGGALNLRQPLPDRGGVLTLLDQQGRLLDRVSYGFQLPDRSVGLSADSWALLTTPTPGQPNAAAQSLGDSRLVRINEWLAAPLEGQDWFELFNPGDAPVDLGGYFLTDDPSLRGLTQFTIAPLSFVPAGGFVLFYAQSDSTLGPDHVNFGLNRLGETIRLSNPALGLVDQVGFGAQAADLSEGRFPDGTARIILLPWRSPLAPNGNTELDLDQDGLPDVWEFTFQLDPDDPSDAALDLDGDGLTNLQEFLSGTDPRDPDSRLVAWVDGADPDTVWFLAAENRSYSVLHLEGTLEGNAWQKWADIPAGPAREVAVPGLPTEGSPARFYRVVTPALP